MGPAGLLGGFEAGPVGIDPAMFVFVLCCLFGAATIAALETTRRTLLGRRTDRLLGKLRALGDDIDRSWGYEPAGDELRHVAQRPEPNLLHPGPKHVARTSGNAQSAPIGDLQREAS
jgi:hypothetical protein